MIPNTSTTQFNSPVLTTTPNLPPRYKFEINLCKKLHKKTPSNQLKFTWPRQLWNKKKFGQIKESKYAA